MRGATTLDHQLKDILKNQSAELQVFQPSFFLYCIKIWNVLDPDLKNMDLYKEFKSKNHHLLKLNVIFLVYDVCGVKLLSSLRLNFSHLSEKKVHHCLKDGTNSMCDCDSATETTLHFLFQC